MRGLVTDCRARALFCGGKLHLWGPKPPATPACCGSCAPPWRGGICPAHGPVRGQAGLLQPHPLRPGGRRHPPPPTPCWARPMPSGSRCSMGQGWAAPWVCPPSTRSTPQATSCPGTASTSPAPPSEGPAILRPPVWAPGPPSTTIPPRSPARPSSPGFSGDLYGADPVVEFFAYLSPSKKFDTLDQLRDCIQNAARRAQEYFQ